MTNADLSLLDALLNCRESAHALASHLIKQNKRIVLSESCTAGLVSASLAGTPGASAALCGSLATYRNSAKREWLNVSDDLLNEYTAVSIQVTREMAIQALKKTSEADFSVAITGHLGPGAPPQLAGQIFVVFAERQPSSEPKPTEHESFPTDESAPTDAAPNTTSPRLSKLEFRLVTQTRLERQFEAAKVCTDFTLAQIGATNPENRIG